MTVSLHRSSRSTGPVAVIPITVQVAAVCYRHGSGGVEFLLVRTSSGRWIFPKGHMDESLSRCEAASREACEEAGALGKIEPRCFHIFKYWKGSGDLVLIEAYLMEVLRTAIPEEMHREPTWFRPEAARRVIAEGRDPESATELATVIDAALRTVTRGTSRERSTARRRGPGF